MTNGDYIRALIIRKVNSLSYEGLMNYVFDVEDVEGEYPILTMAQDGFEKEVYQNISEKKLEELLSSGKYFDDMRKWLERKMK